MKRTLTYILIITTLLTLLFTSCNADASAGLFKQLADAKKPVNIRYKQIIGWNTAKDTLYFLTNDGIYKYDKTTTSTTTVRGNEKGDPVSQAYLDTTGSKIYYLINDGVTYGDSAEIHEINIDGTGDSQLTTAVAEDLDPDWKMKQLLANGLFVIKGTDTVGQTDSFLVAEYQSSPTEEFKNVVLLDGLPGYDRDAVLQMSGRQHWGIGEFDDTTFDAPMILSFVTSGGSYKHYYTNGTVVYEFTLAKKLAGFWTNGTSLYLITKDGNLYGSSIVAGVPTAPTHMKDLSRQFPSNAFVYGMASGGTTYLITKTTTANEALFVVSFLDDNITASVNTKAVSTGYAAQMSNVNIVSAFEKSAGNLLIATEQNGMFDISIPNDPTTGGGTSVGPENYSL